MTTYTGPIYVSLIPYHTSAFTSGELENVMRLPHARHVTLNGLRDRVTKIKNYATTKQIMGKNYMDTDNVGLFGGLGTGNNPTNCWFWTVVVNNQPWGTDTDIVCYCNVKIKYYTECLQKKEMDHYEPI